MSEAEAANIALVFGQVRPKQQVTGCAALKYQLLVLLLP
jgi:hypothetical protein